MKQAYCEVKGRQILPADRTCCPLPSAAIVHKTLNEQWDLTSRAGLTIALNQPELPEMPQCRKLRPTRRFIPRFTIRGVMRVRPRLTPRHHHSRACSSGQSVCTGTTAINPGTQNFTWNDRGNDGRLWPDGSYTLIATAVDANEQSVAIQRRFRQLLIRSISRKIRRSCRSTARTTSSTRSSASCA